MRLESDLRKAVNRHVKPVFIMSNTGSSMYCNGIPDMYYDGPAGDLWVEYKLLRAIPRSKIVVGDYTPGQLAWMTRRYNNCLPHTRTNVVGVVGLPNRTAVIQRTPTEWREGTPVIGAITLLEVSQWITDFCSRLPGS